ncbi:K(lysine) acetyltransferase [Gryganskiella cystojenkinii]|nr:K(lysine) acetyltransferase [Gryganskiella cystojenkinii]
MDTTASSGTGKPAVEIGSHYAIIGMDGREYKVEVMGKRVTDIDTDVYIHYEGTDKRLDEWVDIQRIMPLKEPTTPLPDASQSSLASEEHKDEEQPSQTPGSERLGGAGNHSGSGSTTADGGTPQPYHDDDDDDDVPRVRNVEWILYAGYDIATWYYSPFPEEYHDCQRLFICDHCLKYIRNVDNYLNHSRICKRKRPPGAVIYTKGTNKIYKVDGSKEKLYCQNLSLLAKLFLDNKTLYFDVSGFHFFVLTETRAGDRSDVPVGFFSKETVSYDGYNLACILVLPPFQRKSYGKLLIEFSYELTKMEGKVGSPEKPLSDLGKLGYVSYWITAILRELYPKPWPAKRIPPPPPLSGKSRNRAASLKQGSQTSVQPLTTDPLAPGQTSTQPTSSATSVKQEPSSESTALSAIASRYDNRVPGPLDMDVDVPASSKVSDTLAKSQSSESGQDKEIAFSIRELASKTGIMEEDLLETLVTMGWTQQWLPPNVQDQYPHVKEAKRNYRKLMQFHEQQHLLSQYGNAHEPGYEGYSNGSSEHRPQSHHYYQHQHHSSANTNGGHKHAAAATDHVSQFNSSVRVDSDLLSLSDGTTTKRKPESAAEEPSVMTKLQRLEKQRQTLLQEFDPVTYLEMPDSEEEGEDEQKKSKKEDSVSEEEKDQNQHLSRHQASNSTHPRSSLLSHSDLNPVNVAVVTIEMVKSYQDKHNIRLDYYLDRDAIDWPAYKKSLDP